MSRPAFKPLPVITEFFCVYSPEADAFLSEVVSDYQEIGSRIRYEYDWENAQKHNGEEENEKYNLFVMFEKINIQTCDRLKMIADMLDDDMSDWWLIPCTTDKLGNVEEFRHQEASRVLTELAK